MTWQSLSSDGEVLEARQISAGQDVLAFERYGSGWIASLGEARIPLPNLKNFAGLFPEPDLALGGFDWLLASAPELYLGRLTSVQPILDDITCGDFELTWIDPDGRYQSEMVILDGGEERFDAPEGAAFIFLRRTSR